ncbi:MAG TPA: hypothetical protein DCW31_10350 [Lactobacillus sp.]|nr:hypothetical protein [Lactobacillus sp.]
MSTVSKQKHQHFQIRGETTTPRQQQPSSPSIYKVYEIDLDTWTPSCISCDSKAEVVSKCWTPSWTPWTPSWTPWSSSFVIFSDFYSCSLINTVVDDVDADLIRT